MSRIFKIVVFAFNLFLIAGAGFLLAERFFPAPPRDNHGSHQAFHEILNLTEEQKKKLIPIEKVFAEQKAFYEHQIALSNMKLADVMREEKAYTPEVQAAVDDIHEAMGELQKITLKHIFEMRALLDEEQSEILDDYVADVLYGSRHKK
ncbi:Spy/CpxP family protein refolding chaperone [Luteithermobacter gelatinilyticus]|uniref:Spy/CpxP family protein refolding chaperone n=1 Tax=Luteithermobacter gelatinilyticus TaxID=2582913 RepID=UPI001106412A|nr:periplasmic heavy metal sensor [Luteithermobacter gelatinilyticus]